MRNSMNEGKTPTWLIEAQNKSWEPEIIISGVMLTFVFLLSHYIYNFYGMLIQDFGVYEKIARILYYLSIVIINGLKIILIMHLILRGLWTGLVGLSYVFPHGVKKDSSKSEPDFQSDKPEKMVIKIEMICSLLFSFIFSTLAFMLGFFIVFVPLVMLFIIGLERSLIVAISVGYFLVFGAGFVIFSILLETKLKDSNIKRKIENSLLQNIINIYSSNIGKVKTLMIFTLYFFIVISLSQSDIKKFKFETDSSVEEVSDADIVQIKRDQYNSFRDKKLRFPKATIDQFRLTTHSIELFVSLYRYDSDTFHKLQNNASLVKKFKLNKEGTTLSLSDLFKLTIDEKPITGLKWYRTEMIYTNQSVIMTTLPVDTLKSGYHELKIDKFYWSAKKKEMNLIENWDIIPFEIGMIRDLPAVKRNGLKSTSATRG
ncbi:hypothetical protein ACFL27_21150 [candidate division CSSED10-310 bacterium]|uniref:ABC transporter permease n=1 Tax=candidate division CSSED10-310 bacterium TaxID=2855610 RepID=A0ABV6Z2N2_UNCC1